MVNFSKFGKPIQFRSQTSETAIKMVKNSHLFCQNILLQKASCNFGNWQTGQIPTFEKLTPSAKRNQFSFSFVIEDLRYVSRVVIK